MNKRPSYWSKSVAEKVVESLMPDIFKLVGEDAKEDQQYVDDMKEDLLRAIDLEDDEYRICRNLERSTWEVDSALYDIMSKVAYLRIKHHYTEEKEWVKQHSINLEYSVGQRVTFKKPNGTQVEGEVIKLHEDRASYTVYCESEGHVRSGVGTHGLVIAAEDLALVQEERRSNFSVVSPGVGSRENDV